MTDHYKNTIQSWGKLAEAYHQKFSDLRIYDESYESFVSHIDTDSPSILEIGCGPGTVTNWLRNELPQATILATDVSPEMIAEAKKHANNVQFEVKDAREIDTINGKFDAILAGFIIPYLTKDDLVKFINSSVKLLNKNGIFYLSCIEGEYSSSHIQSGSTGHTMKVHYYLEKDILHYFEMNQYEHLETIRVSYPLPNGQSDTHLVLIGRKN